MITPNLHRRPIALDSATHRDLALELPLSDWSCAAGLNAIFVAGAEFGDACREFPIVFVRAGKRDDGGDEIAPIAVFGLTQTENLFVEGGAWRGRYMPAVLRGYPFGIARIDAERFAICVDLDSAAVAPEGGAGQRLFEADGRPAALLDAVRPQLERLEGEIQRTRAMCRRLADLGVLADMRFDAKLPDGREHTVDGFLTVDEAKMAALPDATVGELHRNGLLGLVHLHWLSLGSMERLVQWHLERQAAAGRGTPAPAAATPATAGAAG